MSVVINPPKQTQAIMFDPNKERQAMRQRAMAEMLVKQGNTPMKNEQAGGMTVARSPWEFANQAAQKGMGEYQLGQAENAQGEVDQQRAKLFQEALGQLESNPQGAAQVLMQDPSMGPDALRLYQEALSDKRASEAQAMGYQRKDMEWQRDADLKRELARMRVGSSGGGMVVDPDTGEITQSYSNKPLPVGALKLQQEALDGLNAAQTISQKSQAIQEQLGSGQLEVGPLENLISGARNWAGMSSPNSINYQNLETDLEKIRNDSLRLNKGVQTEGDAIRAMNEVIKNKNDPKALAAAMQKLDAINQRGAELQQMQINTLRQNYNAAPFDFEQMGGLPPAVPTQATGGAADKVRQHLAAKGMKPEQIEAFIQQRGIK